MIKCVAEYNSWDEKCDNEKVYIFKFSFEGNGIDNLMLSKNNKRLHNNLNRSLHVCAYVMVAALVPKLFIRAYLFYYHSFYSK